jgi:hypothetical protein
MSSVSFSTRSVPDDGDQNKGVIGSLTELGGKVVTALPPVFIALMLINVIFLGITMWFINSQIEARAKVVANFVDRCMDSMQKIESIGAIQARQDALEHDIRVLETKVK